MQRKDSATDKLFEIIENYKTENAASDANEIKACLNDADLTAQDKDGRTPIQLAAVKGYWEGVKTIADNKKTDGKDAAKYTDVLFSAIEAHDLSKNIDLLEVIASLIKADANLVAIKNEKTPMQFASYYRKRDCIQTIAKTKNATQGDPERYGSSLVSLFYAGADELVEPLLKANASVAYKVIKDGYHLMHIAVRDNKSAMVDLLLRYQASPYLKNEKGQTPLELACELGHWECAEKLIKFNEYRFNRSETSGFAFIHAIKAGQLKIAEHLMKQGALTTYKLDGLTALHWAVQQNDIKAVYFLGLHRAVSLAVVNANNETPIELACKMGHWDCAQYLIRSNEKKYTVESLHYEKALLHTIRKGHCPTAKLLITNGAPFKNCNDECGVITLHSAITNNYPEIVKLLVVDHGVDVDVTIEGNQTLRDLAREKYPACFDILRKHPISYKTLDITGLIKERDELLAKLMRNEMNSKYVPQTLDSLERCHADIARKTREFFEKQNARDMVMEILYPGPSGYPVSVPEHQENQTYSPIDFDIPVEVYEKSKIELPLDLFLDDNVLPSVQAHPIYTEKNNTTTLYRNSPVISVENKSEEREKKGLGLSGTHSL